MLRLHATPMAPRGMVPHGDSELRDAHALKQDTWREPHESRATMGASIQPK